jgi:hypothetical protein
MADAASKDADLRAMIRQPAYRQAGAVGEGLRREVAAAYAARYPGPGPREMAAQQGEAMVHVRAHQRRGEDGRPHGVRAYDRSAPPAGSGRPAGAGQAAPRVSPLAAPAQPARPRAAAPGAMPPRAWVGQPNQAWRERIAEEESRGSAARHHGYGVRNASGALGRYQMTDVALRAVGWRNEHDRWTAAARTEGIRSDADFLASPRAQETALNAYLRNNEQQLQDMGILQRVQDPARNVIRDFDGGPLRLTEAGLAAAAHREGPATVRRYLENRDAGLPRPPPVQRRGDLSRFNEVERRLREFADIPYERMRP